MGDVKTYTFFMAMTCSGCSNAAIRVLTKDKFVEEDNIEIDLEAKRIVVKSDKEGGVLLERLRKTGKEVELLSTA